MPPAPETRAELGLPADRRVVATGHQAMLWHPGILAKYLAVQAATAGSETTVAAHLVVDQHVGDFGSFDVPVRGRDGALAVRTITLTHPREGVPMGWHPPFEPETPGDVAAALPCVAEGIDHIVEAVRAHAGAPDAATQMSAALGDLMAPWVPPWPAVRSSELMKTSLAATVLDAMARDPAACAAAYNEAVAAVPEAGIAPLSVTPERVELPLWRRGAGDRREPADHRALDRDRADLLPRALLLTMLVRLGMCDLFVHGTGGARYDRAMELWAQGWLSAQPAPIEVVTASLRLPLADGEAVSVNEARRDVRRLWHDPEPAHASPGPEKAKLLAAVNAAPRRSRERLAAFKRMHARLASMREEQSGRLADARARLQAAREAPIAARRDWAFPLYPPAMIDELAGTVMLGRS